MLSCFLRKNDRQRRQCESLFNGIIKKDQNPRFESYSAVRDDGGEDTGPDATLRKSGVLSVIIYGIAPGYCVKATAIDLVRSTLDVVVVEDLCRAVSPQTSAQAIKQMQGG